MRIFVSTSNLRVISTFSKKIEWARAKMERWQKLAALYTCKQPEGLCPADHVRHAY